MTKFSLKSAFLSIAGSFGALLLGWLVVVAQAVSRQTPIYNLPIFSVHRCFYIAAKSTSIVCSCAVVPTAVAWRWIVCCAPRVAGIKLESVIVHIMLKTEHPRLPHSQVSICIIIALSYFQSQVS